MLDFLFFVIKNQCLPLDSILLLVVVVVVVVVLTKSTPCGKHTQLKDGGHYVWHKAQTAILHYTRGPAK